MANFAGFDRDMNASLESRSFPRTEGYQTEENENLQNHQFENLSQDSDSEDEIIIQIYPASVNTHDLANEQFEAQLIVDNNMSNDDENENEGHIGLFADTDPNAILLDEKMRSGCNCKSKKCSRSFDTDALINHDRLTMREFDKNEKDSY